MCSVLWMNKRGICVYGGFILGSFEFFYLAGFFKFYRDIFSFIFLVLMGFLAFDKVAFGVFRGIILEFLVVFESGC